MTKKEKLLNLFNEKEWLPSFFGRKEKIFTYNDFGALGMVRKIEYGETYNDIIYAKRIFKKLGYSVYIGMAFHIIDKQNQQP